MDFGLQGKRKKMNFYLLCTEEALQQLQDKVPPTACPVRDRLCGPCSTTTACPPCGTTRASVTLWHPGNYPGPDTDRYQPQLPHIPGTVAPDSGRAATARHCACDRGALSSWPDRTGGIRGGLCALQSRVHARTVRRSRLGYRGARRREPHGPRRYGPGIARPARNAMRGQASSSSSSR